MTAVLCGFAASRFAGPPLRASCGRSPGRSQAWGLVSEVTRALTASVVVLRIWLSWQSATSCSALPNPLRGPPWRASCASRWLAGQGRGRRFDPDYPLQQASAFRSWSGTPGSDAHGTQSGYRVPPPIRQFGLPEASAARGRPKGSHLLEIRRRGSLVEQRIVYPPHESSILFVGAKSCRCS